MSNGTHQTPNEAPTPETVEFDDDVIESLNSLSFIPDGEHQSEESASDDTSSMTSGSLTSSSQAGDTMTSSTISGDVTSTTENGVATNGKQNELSVTNLWMVDNSPPKAVRIKEIVENDDKQKKKKKIFKNPLKSLRRMSQHGDIAPPLMVPEIDLDQVTVDTLPQHFVTKYLGKSKCRGLRGLENIRHPIDRMVRQVTGSDASVELPLIQISVWPKGLQAIVHPKSKNKQFEPFYLPIDFISFCAEHGIYQKIVGLICVSQIGPTATKTECHAYICHSPLEARKLTVSMATAFKQYGESMAGNEVKFKLDLRPREEQESEKKRKQKVVKEFEA